MCPALLLSLPSSQLQCLLQSKHCCQVISMMAARQGGGARGARLWNVPFSVMFCSWASYNISRRCMSVSSMDASVWEGGSAEISDHMPHTASKRCMGCPFSANHALASSLFCARCQVLVSASKKVVVLSERRIIKSCFNSSTALLTSGITPMIVSNPSAGLRSAFDNRFCSSSLRRCHNLR